MLLVSMLVFEVPGVVLRSSGTLGGDSGALELSSRHLGRYRSALGSILATLGLCWEIVLLIDKRIKAQPQKSLAGRLAHGPSPRERKRKESRPPKAAVDSSIYIYIYITYILIRKISLFLLKFVFYKKR